MNGLQVYVIGAGGHAKVVIDAIIQEGKYEVTALVDPAKTGQAGQFPIISDTGGLSPGSFVVAIGDNKTRTKLYDQLINDGWTPVSIVHPKAIVAADVVIGFGTVVFAGAIINACARIGANSIINTGAIIEHDCAIGNNSHIAPGCSLAGGVSVGDNSLLGIGSSVLPSIKIGSGVIVGAGSCVIRDVGDGLQVAGVPAKSI